jgi:sugar lactone lactonase YvrE
MNHCTLIKQIIKPKNYKSIWCGLICYLSFLLCFTDNSVGFAIPRKSGGIIVGLGKTVSHLNWQTKEVTLLMELDKECETRMNDAKCDCSGRLWAGTVILLISLQC